MTGTSVDGLDLALISTSPSIRIEAGAVIPLPNDLRSKLLQLASPTTSIDLDLLGHTDVALGKFIGHSIQEFVSSLGMAIQDIAAVGSHGQTVRHRPSGSDPFTLQIGDPHHIQEILKVPVVADFRRRDLAAGGQGAPLVPPFHEAVFFKTGENRVILNIGGIANVSRLADGEPLTGFDTGPGNCLSDAWIAQCLGNRFDDDGIWARTGRVIPDLLQAMLSDPYFGKAMPKSTGREHFNLQWLSSLRPLGDLAENDVQATLVECSAVSIATGIRTNYPNTDRVIVCGGGRLNRFLMTRLSAHLDCEVQPSEELGVDGDSLEAAAFAWLAMRAMTGQPSNRPSVTGASGLRVLGVIYR